MKIRAIESDDNKFIEKLIKDNLKKFNLDIPGTAYYDPELSNLSSYYDGNSKRKYFVLTDGELVLGGVGIAEYNEEKKIAELQKIYLIDKVKGRGLSYKLVDTALEFAKEVGYKQVYLETHHSLEGAVYLYRKYGFDELEEPLKIGEHNAMDMFFIKNI